MYCADLLLGAANPRRRRFATAIGLCGIFALTLHFLVQVPTEKARYAMRGFGKASRRPAAGTVVAHPRQFRFTYAFWYR